MPADDGAPPETPFWRFSVTFYAMPGVAPACLVLQDESGVDVNLLMYLLWSASRGRALAAQDVRSLDGRLARWREVAVVPLRTLRRALKTSAPLVEPAAAERFRTRIKGIELEAERLQQEAMYAGDATVAFRPAAVAEAARQNLAAYQSIRPLPFDRAAIDAVLAAFDAQHAEAGEPRRGTA